MPKFDFSRVSRDDKIKFVVFLVVVVAMIAICIPLIPYFNSLLDEANRQALVESIQSKGALGFLIVLGLQVLQVVVAFIPGEVVQILAGVIYGTVGGLLLCLVGLVISTTIVYKVVTKLGVPFVKSVVPEKYMSKLDFLHGNKKIDYIVFILYLIPGLPKDVFTYFIPLTEMPFGRFLTLSTVARIPGLIASTYAGAAFLEGNYTGMIIIFVIFGGLGILGIVFRDRILEFLGAKKEQAKERIHRRLESRHSQSKLSGRLGQAKRIESRENKSIFPPYERKKFAGFELDDDIDDAIELETVNDDDDASPSVRDTTRDSAAGKRSGFGRQVEPGRSNKNRSSDGYRPTYRRKRS